MMNLKNLVILNHCMNSGQQTKLSYFTCSSEALSTRIDIPNAL
jgi:hypothetical protein